MKNYLCPKHKEKEVGVLNNEVKSIRKIKNKLVKKLIKWVKI